MGRPAGRSCGVSTGIPEPVGCHREFEAESPVPPPVDVATCAASAPATSAPPGRSATAGKPRPRTTSCRPLPQRRHRRRDRHPRRIHLGDPVLINVGDEKGALLDAAIRAADPHPVLELGTSAGTARCGSRVPRRRRRCCRWNSPEPTLRSRGASGRCGCRRPCDLRGGTLGDGGGASTRSPPNTA